MVCTLCSQFLQITKPSCLKVDTQSSKANWWFRARYYQAWRFPLRDSKRRPSNKCFTMSIHTPTWSQSMFNQSRSARNSKASTVSLLYRPAAILLSLISLRKFCWLTSGLLGANLHRSKSKSSTQPRISSWVRTWDSLILASTRVLRRLKNLSDILSFLN